MAPGSLLAAARRSRSSLMVGQPLPMIIEDDDSPPAVPIRSHRRLHFGKHSSSSGSTTTSPYSVGFPSTIIERKREESAEDVAKNSEFRRRRRLYRLTIIGILLLAVIVALAVGIPLGLRNQIQTNTASAGTVSASIFPAGSYTFTTALTNAVTNCTTNPATFRCFPFSTYSATSPSSAAATFSWIIVPLSSYSYSISSSANPFAPSFSDVPLAVLDANQFSERLIFNFSMAKSVVASAPLNPTSNIAATCWFNSTVMSATLWTKMRADYPAGIAAVQGSQTATDQFAPWPYRVEVTQVQDGSADVPTCLDADGKSVGKGLAANGSCGCYYANFGLENGTALPGR